VPFLYLLYVFYGLTLLAAPVLFISLYVWQAKLRKQINDLAEENANRLRDCSGPSGNSKLRSPRQWRSGSSRASPAGLLGQRREQRS